MDRWLLLKAFIQCQLRRKDMLERLLSGCLTFICWFLQYNLCETGGCLHRRAAGSVSAACGWDSSQSSLLRLQHRWWVCFAGPAENESGSWGRPAVFQTGCKLWKQLGCRFGIYFHPDSSSLFGWLMVVVSSRFSFVLDAMLIEWSIFNTKTDNSKLYM